MGVKGEHASVLVDSGWLLLEEGPKQGSFFGVGPEGGIYIL